MATLRIPKPKTRVTLWRVVESAARQGWGATVRTMLLLIVVGAIGVVGLTAAVNSPVGDALREMLSLVAKLL